MSVHQLRPPQRPAQPPKEPILNIEDPAPFVLAAVFGLCHLGFVMAPQSFSAFASQSFALFSANGQVLIPGRPLGSVSTLLTHTLLHADWSHVLMNSAFIAIFGVIAIRGVKHKNKPVLGVMRRGSVVFLAIFVLGAISGGLAQWLYWILANSTGAAIGASSGGAALFACTAWGIGGKKRLMSFGIMVMAFDLFSTLMGGNPAWAAHLGGYSMGAALAVLWLNPNSADIGIVR
ncbi:MAG: hypothetical protein COA69_14370 [Robiginitomaculum sp.]|nr:MAG: hypothetical protein COA69_14370 [Robiginitomaculum sp.]